jgi:hypothetical protein
MLPIIAAVNTKESPRIVLSLPYVKIAYPEARRSIDTIRRRDGKFRRISAHEPPVTVAASYDDFEQTARCLVTATDTKSVKAFSGTAAPQLFHK